MVVVAAGNGTFQEGGGGGGAYASSTFDVTPGNYSVFVGDGGTPGNPGEQSNFGSTVIALGGSSGSGNTGFAGGSGGGSTGDVTFSGGSGGASNSCALGSSTGGGGGGSAFTSGNGENGASGCGLFEPGGGGTGDGGFRGARIPILGVTINGGNGIAPGGGGGGKANQGISGTGAAGQVVVTVNVILPIDLLSFEATVVEDGVALDWVTLTEENNDYMAVERSLDGRVFQEIGRIKGKGTSYERQSYHFLDRLPATGLNYYRLRQVDYDGTTTYHKIVSAKIESTGRSLAVMAFPNPARDQLNVRWTAEREGTALLQVFDMAGRRHVHREAAAVEATLEVPLNDLPAGSYWLRLNVGAELQVVRFEKVN